MLNSITEYCTACGACNNICPNKCITMIADDEGFLYPNIDEDQCTNCNLCKQVCPVLNKSVCKNELSPMVYAAWSLDNEVRFDSTSGGIFTELANYVILQGGYVVGARYNSSHLVEHYIISDMEEICLLRQSKYVQSEIGFVLKDIKELLDNEELVMFVGTPCEGAGLLSFLNKDYDNLLLCDFICRGSNSPKAYLKYLDSIKKKYNSKIKKVWFKNKKDGWNKFCTKIEFENGSEYYADRYTDLYMRGYLKYNLYMRPSCSNCSFKGFPRNSDLTLGDFWGVKLNDESIDTDRGTSLVIINSQKGKKYFENIDDQIFKQENAIDKAISFNQCGIDSVMKGNKRNYFFEKIDSMDFEELMTSIINTGLVKG